MNAFNGLKVLEFAWVVAGPFLSSYFARHGATVVKVESPTQPDMMRLAAPYKDGVPGLNRSGAYAFINVNKYHMTLNLNHPKGLELARKLVAWADIVSENFTPGRMEQWGLGYEDLKKIKPDIILIRSSNQGQTGPQAARRGFGILLTSQAGFNAITGWQDRGPSSSYFGYTDFIAPRFAATALIAALIYRRRTGKGLCLDMSQLEASQYFLAPLILDYTVHGRDPRPAGNSCPNAAPHGAYRCKGEDRWCAISVSTDGEWKAFCAAMGHPEWTQEPRFATLLSRKQHEAELNRRVEEWTTNLTAEEVMDLLQEAGVPAGVIKSTKDLLEDPQLNHRNHVWWLEHKEIGPFPHLGASMVFSKTPAEPKMPSPLFGEHNEHVCLEFLGIPKTEFDALLAEGVFGGY